MSEEIWYNDINWHEDEDNHFLDAQFVACGPFELEVARGLVNHWEYRVQFVSPYSECTDILAEGSAPTQAEAKQGAIKSLKKFINNELVVALNLLSERSE